MPQTQDPPVPYRHVIIDEAQDLHPAQRRLRPRNPDGTRTAWLLAPDGSWTRATGLD
jgi:hypothetical protein